MTFINKLILVLFMIIMLGNVNTKKIKTKLTCCCSKEAGGRRNWNAIFYCSRKTGCNEDDWWSGEATCREKGLLA